MAGVPLTDVDGEDPADLDDAALMLFTPETGGVYFVEVAEAGGDDTGTYRVSVTVVVPPGIVVDPASLTIPEDGSGTFAVELATQPSAIVLLSVLSADSAVASVPRDYLTFTTTTWDQAQTVTVTGVADDDAVDDQAGITLTAISSGADYDQRSRTVEVAVADTDTAALVVSGSVGVAEGGTGSFTVELASEPASTVTVSVVSGDAAAAATLAAQTLTFGSLDWQTPRHVFVRGVSDDDARDEAVTFTLAASSAGSDYAGRTAAVTVNVADTDTAGLVLSASVLDIDEGAGGSFTVRLSSEPSAPVTATVSSGDPAVVSVPVAVLTFTDVTWDVAQPVTVSGVGDDDADDASATVAVTASSSDPDYAGKAAAVAVTVADTTAGNQPPTITNAARSVTLDENTALSLQVHGADVDGEDSVTAYAIVGGADAGLFAIGATGLLTMAKDGSVFLPDFESPQDAGTPPDNRYEVVVEVTSGAGDRELAATASFEVAVVDVAELAAVPAGFAVTRENTDSLALAWDESINSGPAMLRYEIEHTVGSATAITEAPGGDTSLLLADPGTFIAGKTVKLRIRAVNGDGEGDWSAEIQARLDDCAAAAAGACSISVGRSRKHQINLHDTTPDADWFGIDLTGDIEYQIDVLGSATANLTLDDPHVVVHDSTGAAVAGLADDDSGTGNDAQVRFTPDADERYYVEVTESGGDATGTYRVTVTETNVHPVFGGGSSYAVSADEYGQVSFFTSAYDDDAEDTATEYSIIQSAAEGGADYADFSVNSLGFVVSRPGLRLDYETKPQYEVKVTATTGSGTRAKSAVQTITVIVDDVECAADHTTVCELVAGAAEREDIGSAGADSDWFEIDLTGGKEYAIEASGSDASPSGGTLADPVVKLYDAAGGAVTVSGSVLADSDSDGDGTARISFVPGSTATFYVEVTEDGADAAGSYTVEVAEEANNAPRITNRDLNVSLLENTALSLQITAADDDADDAVDSYAVVGGLDRALFALDSNGVLTMARNGTAFLPDFERPDDLPIRGSADGAYEVEVEVTSGTGARALAASATFTVTVTDDDNEAPGVPSQLRVTSVELASAAFAWNEPDNPGPDPVDYDLQFRRVGGTVWNNGTAASSRAGEAASLDAATEYEAQVRAANAEGDGEWSAPVSFWTDDCGENTASTCSVAANASTTGRIDRRSPGWDRDWLAVTLTSGTNYRIDVKGDVAAAHGGTLADPAVALMDAAGSAVAGASDDNGGEGNNARLTFAPSSSGTFYIAVSAARGSGLGTYRAEVLILDDCAAATGTTCAATGVGPATGSLEQAGDADWFEAALEAGTVYRFEVSGHGASPSGGTLADPAVSLYDPAGNPVTDSGAPVSDGDSDSDGVAEVVVAPAGSGAYYIEVSSHGGAGVGTYTVAVAEVVPNSAPRVTNSDLDVELTENTALSLWIVAVDDDSGDSITGYAISGGADMALFEIDASGVLSMVSDGAAFAPDYEQPVDAGTPPDNVYEVQVEVTSGAAERELSATADLTVTVIDRLEPPGVPRDFRVVGASLDSVTLAWGPSATTGPAVASYEVHTEQLDRSNPTRSTVSGSDGSVTVSGLAAGEGFRHQVWAVSDEGESSPSSWLHSWTDSCGTDPLTACALRLGRSSDGRIDPADGSGDRDWFEIELAADTEYRFKATGGSAKSELADPTLALYRADQSAVTVAGAPLTDVDGEDPADLDDAALMLFTPEAGGVYFVEVAEAGGDDTGTYRVSVTAVNAPPTFDEGADRTVSATEFEPFTVLVAASDRDATDMPISYSIAPNATDGGADYDAFDVDASSGELTLNDAARADYETRSAYAVKVTATSGSGPRVKSAVQAIAVDVSDVECAGDRTTGCFLDEGAAETEDIGSSGSDTDWLEVSLTTGSEYVIAVSGSGATPSGGTLADPVVKLLDAAGNPVTVSGSEAVDRDVDGDGIATIAFTSDTDADYYVAVSEDGGDATGTYTVSVTDITPRSVSEPAGADLAADNTTAGHVLVDDQAAGSIGAAGDKDWFGAGLDASRVYRISVASAANSGLADPVVTLFDDSGAAVTVSGAAVADSDSDSDGAATIDYRPDAQATYFVEASGLGGATGAYTVAVADVTPAPVRQLAAGGSHSCALRSDGTAQCWGGNDNGQTAVPPQGRFHELGLGPFTTCAVTADGQLYCWGSNAGGVATPPAGADFESVGVGKYHACALKADSTAVCWGLDFYASVPAGSNNDAIEFSAIDVGEYSACGVTAADGSLVCWGGSGVFGLLLASPPQGAFSAVTVGTNHACGLGTDSTATCWGTANQRIQPPTDADGAAIKFASITAGDDHTCGVREDDAAVVCWGLHGDDLNAAAAAGAYTQAATGDAHVCGLRDDGAVLCWGDNPDGRTAPPPDLTADDCAAGIDTICTMAAGGSARGRTDSPGDVDWFAVELDPGAEYTVYLEGGFGDGAAADPRIAGIHDAQGAAIAGTSDDDSGSATDSLVVFENRGVAPATFHVAAASQDGGLGDYWLWVAPRRHGADISETNARDLPAHAGTPGHVTRGGEAQGAIDERPAGHDEDAFAVAFEQGRIYRIDGRGQCSSRPNQSGGTLTSPGVELRRADGTRAFGGLARHLNPADALPASQFADSGSGACGGAQLEIEALVDGVHYIVVRAHNSSHTGTYTVAVAEVSRIVDVDAGADHTCTRSSDRTVRCWGDSADGRTTPPATASFLQIGVGPDAACGVLDDGSLACWGEDDSSNTQSLPSGNQFVFAGVGDSHGCGLGRDGTATCWGANTAGRAQPPAGATFTSISVGDGFNCGVQADGSLACWGLNRSGTTSPPAGAYAAVAAGARHACAIDGDGNVSCWGHSSDGKTTPPAGQFRSIDVLGDFACAVASDGSLACWGADGGTGRVDDAPVAGAWAGVTVGSSHACALSEDATVLCWGDNSSGQTDAPLDLVEDDCAPDGSTSCSFAPGSPAAGRIQAPEDVDWFVIELDPEVEYKIYLDAGDTNAGQAEDVEIVGVHDDSESLIGGTSDTDSGDGRDSLVLFEHDGAAAADFYAAVARQSGDKGAYRLSASPLAPGADVSEQSGEDLPANAATTGHVTVGGTATGTVSLLADGTDADAFGVKLEAGKSYLIDVRGDCVADAGGTLGDPSVELLRADGSRDFAGVATHVNAVDELASSQFRDRDSGECDNARLEIEARADGVHYITVSAAGASATGTYTVAVTDTTRYQVDTISAGEAHTCARIDNVSVQCWGNAGDDRTVPPAGTRFAQIELGPSAACGVTDEARVECWGLDDSGNVTQSPSARRFAWAGVGQTHGCALRLDGSVACWGDDADGRAAPPTDADDDPVLFNSLSVGGAYNCGVTTGGSLECWGQDRDGRTNPPATGTYTSVATGARHACAVGDDATVVCWGSDAGGRASAPSGTFTSIDSIGAFTCGVMTDNSVACWGSDTASGRVSNAPTAGSYVDVAVGSLHACALSDTRIVTCWGNNGNDQITPPATLPISNFGPRFTSSPNGRVFEHQTLSHTVVAVDANIADTVAYAITGGDDSVSFQIHPSTGVITQAAGVEFDYETGQTSFSVVVTATSGTGDRELSATQTITITVRNVGERPPRPDAPTLPSVGSDSVQLDWTVASHGGPPITSVFAQYRKLTSASYESQYTFDFAPDNPLAGRVELGDLEPGTAYAIRVALENDDGPSAWSPEVQFTTATDDG